MAWTVDQASLGTVTDDNDYGTSPVAFTTNQAVAAGAWVFLGIGWFFTANLSSINDGGLGLSWTYHQGGPTNDSNIAIARAYSASGFASGATFTPVFDSGDHGVRMVGGSSWLGGDTNSFDAVGTPSFATTTGWTTGNLVTAETNELVLGAVFAGFDNSTVTSPSVEDFETHGTNTAHILSLLHRIEASAGTYTVAGTGNFATDSAALGLTMKVASGGAPISDAPEKIRVVQSALRW